MIEGIRVVEKETGTERESEQKKKGGVGLISSKERCIGAEVLLV